MALSIVLIFRKARSLGGEQPLTLTSSEVSLGEGSSTTSGFMSSIFLSGGSESLRIFPIKTMRWVESRRTACLKCPFPEAEQGSLRLSRDWQTRNSYIFNFDKGTVVYEVGHANKLNLWLDGTPFLLSGDLVEASIRHELEKRDTRTNLQSFIEQIGNVVATMKGLDSLRVPGEEGIRSLRLLEACYGSRTLIDMPWLSARERSAAEALAAANV